MYIVFLHTVHVYIKNPV